MRALVLQCGGPTAVVNASLAALIRRWRGAAPTGVLHGGHQALNALVTGEWRALGDVGEDWLSAIEGSPGMALGGGRSRLTEAELDRAVSHLESRGVDVLFLMGGNGTMAAGRVLSAHAARRQVPLRIVGVPKTIDNDIPHTDMCPGFASAARFLVGAVADIAADAASMRGYEDVVLIETMGRHAGWLAVATAFARVRPDDAPHVVLVPEEPFDETGLLAMVREQHGRTGTCVVTVAEGVRNASGVLLAESSSAEPVERDPSGQVIFGRSAGPSPHLATLIRQRLALQCRVVRPDVLQRCSRAHVSPLDRTLAALAGAAAVDAALAADAGHAEMIALRLADEGWTTQVVPLEHVRGQRTVPEAIRRDPEPLRKLVTG